MTATTTKLTVYRAGGRTLIHDGDPVVPVAGMLNEYFNDGKRTAYAHLFAAAPAMREALEGIMRLGADLDRAGIINSPEICAARAALDGARP